MLSKISLGINAVLIVAVGYLFLRKPSHAPLTDVETGKEVKIAEAFSGEESPRPVVLAYVNGDTLNERYAFIVEKSEQLESKMKAAEARVKKEYGTRQQEWQSLMAYAEKNQNMSDKEAMVLQNRMAELQAEMDQIQQREMGTLQKQEAKLQEELQKRVNKFLEVYSKQKGIDYVVNHQSSFQVLLYGSSAYDITDEVLAGLNAEYAKEKEAEKK